MSFIPQPCIERPNKFSLLYNSNYDIILAMKFHFLMSSLKKVTQKKGSNQLILKSNIGWHSQRLEENINRLNDGDLSSIPWIFCVFSEGSDKHKLDAAKALSSILERLKFSDICRIDMQMRHTTSMEWSINWSKFNVQDFFTNDMSLDEKRAVIIFSTFNPNGYIREQAVKLLSSYELTLSYIILRQNDWVLQVRQASSLSFDNKIKSGSDEELLQSLPFIEKLRRSTRGSHIQSINTFFEKLNSPSGRNVIIAGLKSPEILTRKVCVNALLNSQIPNSADLISHLQHEPDPFLRRLIFQKLDAPDINLTDVSIGFLKDKHPINRSLALQYLFDHKNQQASDEAVKMALDKSTYVRKAARMIIKEINHDFDVHKIYLENLTKHTQTAILGLGEVGNSTDCTIIEPYMRTNCISIVRAAMVALMKLDSQSYGSVVIEMLTHEKVGIIKAAKLLIEKYSIQDFPRILEIFKTTNLEYTQIKCAALLYTASKWQRLIYMLMILESEFENVRLLATDSIYRWINSYNKSFVQATNEQKGKILKLVNEQGSKLKKQVINQLLFLLK